MMSVRLPRRVTLCLLAVLTVASTVLLLSLDTAAPRHQPERAQQRHPEQQRQQGEPPEQPAMAAASTRQPAPRPRAEPRRDQQMPRTRLAERVVHLDLKGAPPRPGYLRKVLPLMAAAGATALLVEYEDMFPYSGSIANLSARNAYSVRQVRELVSNAQALGLQVIPLVQTFGHLEMALKQHQWAHLREERAHPDAICPSRPNTMLLLKEMLRQVLHLHPGARYVHVGCDEVYHMGTCPLCVSRQLQDWQLFSQHVTAVAEAVRSLGSNAKPLIWDDMLRRWPPAHVAASGLGSLVEPVVWAYGDDVGHLVPHYAWHSYATTFPAIWVASAFKGAYGETAMVPSLHLSLLNHLSWLRLTATSPQLSVRGVVLTGWSRYDHFAALCETLPVALPSLVLNLLLVSEAARFGSKPTTKLREQELLTQVFRKWVQHLQCPRKALPVTLSSLETDPYQWRLLSSCGFPGSDLYSAVEDIAAAVPKAEVFLSEVRTRRGWLTPWHVAHNWSSPSRIVTVSAEAQAVASQVEAAARLAGEALAHYVSPETVTEWLEQRVGPQLAELGRLQDNAAALMTRDEWPRGPLQDFT